FVTYAPVSVLDVMITDEFADSSFVDSLRSTGVSVICAKVGANI
ncbi:MAG: DeoR/GlpR transcriptional regulator, partial [Clostridiaceae bacterium]|nr:DeoR/GlpR transcriptional regulator [Clostridiaceae bacterium]